MTYCSASNANRMSVTLRPAAQQTASQQQGSLPPRKCTPAVNCGMLTLLVVQQWCDRRDVGRSRMEAGCDMVCVCTLGSKSAETAMTHEWRDRHNSTHGTSERKEATRPSQASVAGCENDASLLAGKEKVKSFRRSRNPAACGKVRALSLLVSPHGYRSADHCGGRKWPEVAAVQRVG
jgi:hypothetical protein